MSRIHEALKKAEQDRAAILQSGQEPVPVPVALPAPVAVDRGDSLSYELIRERAQHLPWNMDPRVAIFMPGRSQDHSSAPGSEEFRTLRSRLYQIRDRQPLQSVLITSALPAEGKTFVTANLAQVIVKQHERKALVIDGDLRWSRLHLTFGAPQKPGLSDYLLGDAQLLDVIQRGPYENLFFIPGGRPVSNPAELIAGERMKDLLKRLPPLFDWVLMDSPPVVPVADASLLADLCDGVLMVVRCAITPFDMAQKAVLEFREKHLIGVVLNDVEARDGYSSYYYHYYQGKGAKNGNH
jgi:capsular exopolysaccharide synthesis family protein